MVRAFLTVASLCLSLIAHPAAAGEAATDQTVNETANETYDLMFKAGALNPLMAAPALNGAPDTLTYDRVVEGAGEKRESGVYTVGLRVEPGDNVALTLHQAEKSRKIGEFPASVGNPIIMYFMESALADVASVSGGSPFYLRNRIKEALLRPATITPVTVHRGDRDIAARRITITPFVNDAAKARMGRFAELSLSVTVSDEIPGWYQSLEAAAPAGPDAATAPAYAHSIILRPVGADVAGGVGKPGKEG